MIFDDFRNLLGCERFTVNACMRKSSLKKSHSPAGALEADRSGMAAWQRTATKIMFAMHLRYRTISWACRPANRPSRQICPGGFRRPSLIFCRCDLVHVRRQDVFAQAVSMYLAEATQVWEDRAAGLHPHQPRLLRLTIPRGCCPICANSLPNASNGLAFSLVWIKPLTIDYEHAVAEYPQYMALCSRARTCHAPSLPAPAIQTWHPSERNLRHKVTGDAAVNQI